MSTRAQITEQSHLTDERSAVPDAVGGSGGNAYLRHVEELRQEIEEAMRAISGNQLSVLEESLWRQQVLCTGLKHLSHGLAAEDASGPLMERVREASTRLFEVNRAYAYLMEQTAGVTDVLLRLTKSYQSEGTDKGGVRSSWSCEA